MNNNILVPLIQKYISPHTDQKGRVDLHAVLQAQKKRIGKINASSVDQLSEIELYDLFLGEILEQKCYRNYLAFVLPTVNTKPESIETLLSGSKIIKESESKRSVWEEKYPGLVKTYLHEEKIGFDKCTFAIDPYVTDEDFFYKQISLYKKIPASKEKLYTEWFIPRVKITAIDPECPEEGVKLPGLTRSDYKEIKIMLSPYIDIEFRHNNVEGKGDVFLIKTRVMPFFGFEELGNIGNYSIDDIKGIILGCIYDSLYMDFGVKIDRENITFRKMEVNLTAEIPGTFKEITRLVSYHQAFIRKGYSCGTYKHKGVKIARYKSKVKKDTAMIENGLVSKSASMKILLYDKAFETAHVYDFGKSGDTVYEKVLEKETESSKSLDPYLLIFEKYKDNSHHCLLRIEFSISKDAEIQSYFGKDWDLSINSIDQDRLVTGWKKLIKTFFMDTYRKYYDHAKEGLIRILKNNEPSKKNVKWRENLIRDILNQEIVSSTTPFLLRGEDIRGLIKESGIKTFIDHPTRYQDDLINTLRDSKIFIKEESSVYEIMATLFTRSYKLEDLSDTRKIVYAVGCDPDKKPELAKKLTYYAIEKEAVEKELEKELEKAART